jgi:hypothetical protein
MTDQTYNVILHDKGVPVSIDAVMEAQKDLVEIVHPLRQVVCVKGVTSHFCVVILSEAKDPAGVCCKDVAGGRSQYGGGCLGRTP